MRCRVPSTESSFDATAVIASAAKQSSATATTPERRPWIASPAARKDESGSEPASGASSARPALASLLLPAACLAAALTLAIGGCTGVATSAAPLPATGTLRERIAALTLRQVDFGAVSIIPVRFEKSRISGPFADGGRTLYCVSSHMKGRTFGKAERPKAVIRDEAGVLKVLSDEAEVCEGHRTEPFAELDSAV